jgi:predicted TIM-barrel fold metal-dependent hydrolase
VVDMHNHSQWFGEAWDVQDVPALVAEMDAAGVAARVDLDGGVGDRVKRHMEHFRDPYPDRFAVFAKFDWPRYLEAEGFGERMAGDLREAARAGAEGLKVWKDLGLTLRDPQGRRLTTSDPRLDPIWQTAAELGLPVLIHTADPVAFFTLLDGRNERYEELARHPDWHFHGPGMPSFAQVQEEFEALVGAHPRTTFIGAHVASHAENLAGVAARLGRYPNLYVDIAARHAELGRQPGAARRFLAAQADRVVFGLDVFPATAADYRVVYRFLETDDDYFDYLPEDAAPSTGAQGRWKIYGLGLDDDTLRKVYHATALRLVPRFAEAVRRMAGG